MNSIMLISGLVYARVEGSPPSLDARHALGSHLSGVHRPRRQYHAVAGLEQQALSVLLEDEGDRTVNAVEHLLIGVAVRRVAVMRCVPPGVAALGLRLPPLH